MYRWLKISFLNVFLGCTMFEWPAFPFFFHDYNMCSSFCCPFIDPHIRFIWYIFSQFCFCVLDWNNIWNFGDALGQCTAGKSFRLGWTGYSTGGSYSSFHFTCAWSYILWYYSYAIFFFFSFCFFFLEWWEEWFLWNVNWI